MSLPVSYSKFKFGDLPALGIAVEEGKVFLKNVMPVEPSDLLKRVIERNRNAFAIGTEKARSEQFVAPILTEMQEANSYFRVFSGYQFDVDKSRGLKGHCDFLLSKKSKSLSIQAPIIAVVEAKNDNVLEGVPPCLAEMFASQLFNEKEKNSIQTIHGVVTSGTDWLFLRLDPDKKAVMHDQLFQLTKLEEVLGALQTIIDFYKD